MNDKYLESVMRLDKDGLLSFFKHYVRLLQNSIRIRVDSEKLNKAKSMQELVSLVTSSDGWKESIYGYSWNQRADRWYKEHNNLAYYNYRFIQHCEMNSLNTSAVYATGIPMFPSMVRNALSKVRLDTTTKSKEKPNKKGKEKMANNKFKTTFDSVCEDNKDAAKLAGNLIVGKSANRFFLGKLVGKLPWYSKLFGKKKEMVENPIAKLATAELANTLVTHFAPENDKLRYISNAMVKEAMVDISMNSQVLESLLKGLEDAVDLPVDFLNSASKGE